MKYAILQIAPAEGWHVHWIAGNDPASESVDPLACWALVEQTVHGEPLRRVIGMVAGDEVYVANDEYSEIVQYVAPADVASVAEKIRERLAKLEGDAA